MHGTETAPRCTRQAEPTSAQQPCLAHGRHAPCKACTAASRRAARSLTRAAQAARAARAPDARAAGVRADAVGLPPQQLRYGRRGGRGPPRRGRHLDSGDLGQQGARAGPRARAPRRPQAAGDAVRTAVHLRGDCRSQQRRAVTCTVHAAAADCVSLVAACRRSVRQGSAPQTHVIRRPAAALSGAAQHPLGRSWSADRPAWWPALGAEPWAAWATNLPCRKCVSMDS